MQSAEITAEQRRAEHAALDEAGAVMSRQRLPTEGARSRSTLKPLA